MIVVRDAGPEDAAFLLRALGWATNWRGTEAGDSVLADPAISHYLDGWPRDGDFGVVAEQGGIPALSLSVENGNDAVRLYERVGFRPAGRSGGALTMMLDLR